MTMNTRIEQNNGLPQISKRTVSETRSSSSAPASGGASTAAAGDKLSLSAQADRLSTLTRIAAASPDIDTAKVEALRAQIAEGNYEIDADRLASSMLQADRQLGRQK